jgi:hypothetical protein
MNSFGDDPSSLNRSISIFHRRFAKVRGFAIEEGNSVDSLAATVEALYRNFADIPIVTQTIQIEDGLFSDRTIIIVLIEEYDAPIINNITNHDKLDKAKQTLHGFYNALKSCGNMIDRVFITGITKFAQLSVFPAMNNLRDITFQPRYAAICGYTHNGILKFYSQHLDAGL